MKATKKKIYSKKHNTFRYHIGYYDNNKVIPLIIELPQMIGYCNINDDGNKAMCLGFNDKLLKKYGGIDIFIYKLS